MAHNDTARTVPKHQRVRELLAAEIRGLEPHALLPTERELATTHEVSRATIRIALDGLSDAGVVYRIQGAGTFVAGPAISKTLNLSSFSEDMEVRGWQPSSRLLEAKLGLADAEAVDDLGIAADAEVITLSRLRLADGRPICAEIVRLAGERVPGLLGRDLSGSLYETLESDYGLRVVRAEQVVQSVNLSADEADLLDQPVGAAALRVHRIGLDPRDRPIESTTSLYRGDLYDLRFAVHRRPAGVHTVGP